MTGKPVQGHRLPHGVRRLPSPKRGCVQAGQGTGRAGRVQTTTPRTLTLSLPHLPYPELNPNARCHWSEKAKVAKIARTEIGWLAKEQWHDDKPMMVARITYRFLGKRMHDFDNLVAAMKSSQDGLIDAGVIFYDDAKHLTHGLHTLTTDDHDATEITITEVL